MDFNAIIVLLMLGIAVIVSFSTSDRASTLDRARQVYDAKMGWAKLLMGVGLGLNFICMLHDGTGSGEGTIILFVGLVIGGIGRQTRP